MRRLAVLAVLGGLGCGSRPQATPAPQSMNETVAQFLAAVKANDLQRMGSLWGTGRGPAAAWMKPDDLKMRITVIQRYLMHDGYRIVEGPLSVPGRDNARTFRIELQRQCNVVVPLDIVRTKQGGWLIADVHLEALPNPAASCKPPRSGTGP
jgi:hypothetical protein